MVEDIFLEEFLKKFNKILVEIQKEKGEVSVFMLIKRDEFIDRWSVVLGAPWVTGGNVGDVLNFLVGKLRKNLSPEEASMLARVEIFARDEELIRLITSAIKHTGTSGPIRLIETRFNDYIIHDAWIFKSV